MPTEYRQVWQEERWVQAGSSQKGQRDRVERANVEFFDAVGIPMDDGPFARGWYWYLLVQ